MKSHKSTAVADPPEVATAAVAPPDDLWDRAALAALAGVASEVRLTADETVHKAGAIADRFVDAWDAHYNPPAPPPGQLATVNIAPTSDSLASTPETSSFAVTVVDPGSWSAVSSDTSWLTVVSPTAEQTVDGDVTYATSLNNTGSARTATITVNSRTFTVVQGA